MDTPITDTFTWRGIDWTPSIIATRFVYPGPLNKVPGLDFIGANSAGYPAFYIPLSIALIVLEFLGRARQLRN